MGRSSDRAVASYMLSYSPYDNTTARDYPALYITAGLNDARVSYHEPAKWCAKLRALRTNDAPLIMTTEMGAGHAGPSGRYDRWRDEALVTRRSPSPSSTGQPARRIRRARAKAALRATWPQPSGFAQRAEAGTRRPTTLRKRAPARAVKTTSSTPATTP